MQNLFKKLHNTYCIILDFLFPRECLGCAKEGRYICEKCLSKLPINLHNSFSTRVFKEIYVLTDWNDKLVKKLIKKLKFYFAKDILNDLQSFLKTTLQKIKFPENAVLVAVPLHYLRFNERGFNQSELLVNIIANIANLNTEFKLLTRIKNTYPQSKLKGFVRRQNLKDAFCVDDKIAKIISKDTPIFLVDDIASTLTTLNECAIALKRSGYKNLSAIVFARGANFEEKQN